MQNLIKKRNIFLPLSGDPMPPEKEYKLQILKTLSEFQTLELALKIYIAATYKIIKNKLQGTIPFNYSYKDIEKHPVGKLLQSFQKLNDNTELQARLNNLTKSRNHIAHKGLILAHPEVRDLFDEDLSENHDNIISIEEELDNCLKLLTIELEKAFAKIT